jgi:hypothetical protein
MWLAIAYCALSSVLFVHTVFQFRLLVAARRGRRIATPGARGEWPRVTVQLPIYNERYVAARLLEAIAALDYPRDRLDIQVLDDSTDETTALVAERCRALREQGLAIEHVRRGDRAGFKAGALQYGLERARGELVLLFDADFMPRADFLRETVPHFADPRVAAVQARWTHANRDESLLTRIQGFFLDVHFSVEQVGRRELGCFVNFNGTAGIWRIAAIRDAGGWCADTLTEDLDLSYRTQLRGWRIVFLDEIEAPAELPADVRAFRAQQYRWMKGLAQNAVRLLPTILRAPLPARVKAHACAHLFESSNFAAMLMVLLLTPILAGEVARGTAGAWTVLNPIWLVNAVLLAPVYFAPRRGRARGVRGWLGGLSLWVGFLAVSAGLSLHNTVAVLAGFAGRRSDFVRTPKAGDGPAISRGAYRVRRLDGVVPLEVLLWLYMGGALIWAARAGALYLMWIPGLAFVGLTALLAGYLRPIVAGAWR